MTRAAILLSESVWFSSPKSATLSPKSSLYSLNMSRNRCNSCSSRICAISGDTSSRFSGSNQTVPGVCTSPSPSSSFQTDEKTSFFENRCFSLTSFAPIRILPNCVRIAHRFTTTAASCARLTPIMARNKKCDVFFSKYF